MNKLVVTHIYVEYKRQQIASYISVALYIYISTSMLIYRINSRDYSTNSIQMSDVMMRMEKKESLTLRNETI